MPIERPVDLAVDGDLPRSDAQLLGFRRDFLRRPELIEIVVVDVDFFVRHCPTGVLVGGIWRCRIKAL